MPKGRGAALNPHNRFETIHLNRDEEWDPSLDPAPKTVFYRDHTKSILSYNDSPDVGFNTGLNPYRGCEHGCVYCFARPTHEYLSFSSGLDFESRILVKEKAPELLRREFQKKKYQPQPIALSGNTDCYQPVERRLKITRRCLEVLAEFRHPVAIITKNRLIERDIDLLKELAQYQCISTFVSVTTLDRTLARKMEPRASTPEDRLHAIRALSAAGIPVGVLVAPVVPGLTDEEIPAILKAAREAGAERAGYIMLRLPFAVKDLFEAWLEEHFPLKKEKILHRIREIRGGKLNDPNFKSRMHGHGPFAASIRNLFSVYLNKYRFPADTAGLTTAHFKRPEEQMRLF